MQVSNFDSPFVDDDERFIYDGELKRLWLDGEDLCARFRWIAQRGPSVGEWYMLTDPTLLDFRMSLLLLAQTHTPDRGRLIFFPRRPIANEQLLLVAHDYVGPSGRTPLKREEVLPAR